jgi:hypothetical protein
MACVLLKFAVQDICYAAARSVFYVRHLPPLHPLDLIPNTGLETKEENKGKSGSRHLYGYWARPSSFPINTVYMPLKNLISTHSHILHQC